MIKSVVERIIAMKDIENELKKRVLPHAENTDIYYFDRIESTNTFAKELANRSSDKRTAVILAKAQSAGRGSNGRGFISKAGRGVYLSILFYPQPEVCAADITVYAAVKICRAIESLCPLNCKIKWVNDIYINDRKLAGILTEGRVIGDSLEYAVMGVGINTRGKRLPHEISKIATSIEKECGKLVDSLDLAEKICKEFLSDLKSIKAQSIKDEYKNRSMLIGRTVSVLSPSGDFLAKVLEIRDTGAIILEDEQKNTHELQSGTVSLQIQNGEGKK